MHYKIEVQISDNNSLVAFRNNLKEVDEVIKDWTNPEKGYRRFKKIKVLANNYKLVQTLEWTENGLERKDYKDDQS